MICFKCDRCGEVFDGYKVDGFNGIAKIKTEKNGANIIAGEEPIQLCPSCMVALGFSDDRKAYERIGIIASEKYYRWLHRLQDKEQSDE